jgi:DNA-directed RNA polymerase specialized sigma24 family protein
VNERYLELIKIKALPPDAERGDGKAAFFSLVAFLMRRLLIHHSLPQQAKAVKVELDDSAASPGVESVAEIEVALSRLNTIRPRLRAIVELKVLEGMTLDEVARQWLQKELAFLDLA